MPVPDYQSPMLPALEALSGGVEVPLSKVRERVAAAEGLTAEGYCQVKWNSRVLEAKSLVSRT